MGTMKEALKKAEAKQAEELAKADPFVMIDLDALSEKEKAPEEIAKAQAEAEAKESEKEAFVAKVSDYESQVTPAIMMMVEKREVNRGVTGAEVNFRLYDGEVGKVLIQTSANPAVGDMTKSVYVLATAKHISETEVLFRDLAGRKMVNIGDDRPKGGFFLKLEGKYISLGFRAPGHLYAKVCEALSGRVGEVYKQKREDRIAEEEALRKWAKSDNATEVAVKAGKYFLEVPPITEVIEKPVVGRDRKSMTTKEGKIRMRKETISKSSGGALALEVDSKGNILYHSGIGVGQRYVAEGKGITLPVSCLTEGKYFHKGKGDWKVAQTLRRLTMASMEYQMVNGRSLEAEKELVDVRKDKSLISLADVLAGKTGSALVNYADLMGDPNATWDQPKIGGCYFRTMSFGDRKRVYYDRIWNAWGILTCEAGELKWTKVASHFAPYFGAGIGVRLEGADGDELPRGTAMKFFRFAKNKANPEEAKPKAKPKAKTAKSTK